MKMPPTEFDLLRTITELTVQMKSVTEIIKRLDDINEGTVERKGMKERMTLAEHELKEHKEAWIKNQVALKEMEGRINTTLREAFMEVTKRIDSVETNVKTIEDTVVGDQNLITKIQPYVSIVGWIITIIAGVVISQIVTGNWKIVQVP